MKHIFIINPTAGIKNHFDDIKDRITQEGITDECILYETKGAGDATRFVKEYCDANQEPVRFYACGGDGTLNEVANGVVGYSFASVGCVPCGSGNDFVKYYGGMNAFSSIKDIINGVDHLIDLIKVGTRYCINIMNFGLDSFVAKTMMKLRRTKIIGGKNSYKTSVILALIKAMKNKGTVMVGDEILNPDGKYLLCTIGNGQYVGSKYRCSPKSSNHDGLLDVCLVKPISRFTFIKLMNTYEKGEHLDDKRFQKYIYFRKTDRIRLIAPAGKTIVYTLDGELFEGEDVAVEVVHNAINFVVPKNAKSILAGD